MSRVDRERKIVEYMVRFYCRRAEGNRELCADCSELLAYSLARLDHCPYGVGKHSCKKCHTHCYQPKMRERIRKVMRYTGPRMIFYAPLSALRHLFNM